MNNSISVIFNMILKYKDEYELIEKIQMAPDNSSIIVSCRSNKAAKLYLRGNNLIVESDNQCKKQLKEILEKMISEEKQQDVNNI